MLFSVIIPIHNAEKTLESCLESVLAQSCGDYEALLIDDGSSDRSARICAEYAARDARFRPFSFPNAGVSAARNRGLERARGEYAVFLDSDDRYSPSYLESFAALMREHPACGHFWCGYRYVSSDPAENGRLVKLPAEETLVCGSRAAVMDYYEAYLLAPIWNKVFRLDTVRENGLTMREDLSLGEDLLFNLDYLDCVGNTEIAILNEALYEYSCFAPDSLNHKYRDDLPAIYAALIEGLYTHLSRWGLSREQMAKFYSASYGMQYQAMRNVYHPLNPLGARQKRKNNNAIMRSTAFREAVRLADCPIHPLQRLAFAAGDYRCVQLVEALARWRQAHKRQR